MKQTLWPVNADCSQSGYSIHKILGRSDGWSYPEHTHRGYCEMVCATEGRFQHVVGGQPLLQEAGMVVMIREDESHELSGRDFAYVNLMCTPDWLARLDHFVQVGCPAERLLAAKQAPRAIIPPDWRKCWVQELEQLLANSASSRGRSIFMRFLLSMVVDHLAPAQDQSIPPDMPNWLQQTLDWVARNRTTVPTVAELVKHGGRCHEHVTRQFTQHVGMSPTRYLSNLRVDRAADLLATTNYKLLDICHAVGFENEGYFYRSFRTRKGVTPLNFRRIHGPRSIQR